MNRKCTFFKLLAALVVILQVLVPRAHAQSVTVSGTVKNIDNQPLPGVTVVVENTTKGAITDQNGKYSIAAPSNGTLLFQMLGMQNASVAINNRTSIDITMAEVFEELDAVVAVGYSTMRRSDLTGSVVSISSKSIEESVVTTVDQVLMGRVSGMQMMQNSGVPGGGFSSQIRGVNSLNSTNEPIYVVDGVIISGETGSNTTSAIADINPADIESLEVLKDASAAAIYGAQGANGVIIITLKKGKEGAPKVNFNAYYGIQQLPRKIDMMDLSQYARHYNEIYTTFGYLSYRKHPFSHPEYLGKGTDWQDAIFDIAPMQNYSLSVRGGNKVNSYSLSAGYMNQDGIALGSGFERLTLRLNLETNVRDWLKMGGTINISHTGQQTSIAGWSLLQNALYQSPMVPVLNADGSYGGVDVTEEYSNALGDFSNPVGVASLTDRDNEKLGGRGNLYLLFVPTKWMNFRTEFTGDGSFDNYMYFLPSYKFGYSGNAYATTRRDKTYNLYWGWKNIVNFEYTKSENHKATLMLGHEMTQRRQDYLMAQRTNGSNELKGIDAGDANYATNSGNGNDKRFVSVFGRLFYSYKNRYQFTGTLRYDGSSNFAMGHQWGLFPSAAIAWRLSEEPFFKKAKKVVNGLKLRVSYGEVGNSNVSDFAYEAVLNNVQSIWGSALQTDNIPNQALTWETTRSWNIGLDATLFKNRIEFIFDAYVKNTDDLLMQLDLTGVLGTTGVGSVRAPWYNIGEIENRGLEFTLNTVNMDSKNFSWRTGATFSLNRNKVKRMNTESAFIDRTYQLSGVTSTVTRTERGRPISQFYGFNTIGRIDSASDFLEDNGDGTSTVKVATKSYKTGTIIDNNEANLSAKTYIGDLLFDDLNGDGIITDEDRTFIGTPLPKYTFGLNNSFRYKNLDLSIFLYGSVGNQALNWIRRRIDNPRSSGNLRRSTANYARLGYLDGNSANTDIWNVYVLPGAESDQVRLGASDPNDNSTVSSRFVEDASYLRIQNISLGYTLPKKWTSGVRLDKVRVYATLQNVYTFTRYTGYDPEVGSTQGQYSYSGQSMLMYGVDAGRIPTPRIYTLGIDFTF
jgi:TonB-linked SusC/RagA family outer membrane protein